MTEQHPLTPEEIKKLRNRLFPIAVFSVFTAGIFAAMYHFVLSNIVDGFDDEPFVMIVFGFFIMIFAGVIAFQVWAIYKDITNGYKERIAGEVTDKRMNVHTSTTHRSSGRRSGTSTKTTRHYYLYINGQEHSVDYRYYSQARVGDHVVMDRAPKSKVVLNFECIEGETEDQHEEIAIDTKFLMKEFPDQRLTEKDLKVLKKNFYKDLRTRLLFMSPFLFILYGLLVSELIGLVIIFFPLFMVPMWNGFRVMRNLGFWIRNKQYAHKHAVPVLVTDKQTHTSNRTATKQTVYTSSGNVAVETRLYDQLQVGDKLIMFKPKYGKQILSVMTMDQEESYV
ncbi:hypothetical protein [Marinoscillum pacificum]|uniref:hypothetical protein n=1 Tax=Marinoscillum pacificum TaxID=392723 RepID=UPI00215880CC|nr:hypothetical protein [Marinoscillum pacificum]